MSPYKSDCSGYAVTAHYHVRSNALILPVWIDRYSKGRERRVWQLNTQHLPVFDVAQTASANYWKKLRGDLSNIQLVLVYRVVLSGCVVGNIRSRSLRGVQQSLRRPHV